MQREGDVVGLANDHLIDEQLSPRAGLIDAPFHQRLAAGGRWGGRLLGCGVRPCQPVPASRGPRWRVENRDVSWIGCFRGGWGVGLERLSVRIRGKQRRDIGYAFAWRNANE